jgi:hypothetical protein
MVRGSLPTATFYALVLATASCGGSASDRQAKSEYESTLAAAKAKLSEPVNPRVVRVGSHEMLVVEVPTLDYGIVPSSQRCFVWRDLEFRSATMSCDGSRPIATDERIPDAREERSVRGER